MRFLVIILLLGAFLGGYYLRGLPDSPDVFGWAQETYRGLETSGSRASDPTGVVLEEEREGIKIELDGKTYVIGK